MHDEIEYDDVVEWMPTTDLRPHPRQAELVGDCGDAELEELEASIRDHGIQQPIEVLPDGTIVTGHQRWRAACRLELAEVPVRVRHDLAEAGEAAVLTHLVEDNVLRRQMGPLAIARAYRALKEIERNLPYEELYPRQRREIRDRLARRLGTGVSGRTLDRYERLLDTPQVIQDAFSQQLLPMTIAIKVPDFSNEQKELMEHRIAAGESVREVVESMLPTPEPADDDSLIAYRRLLSTLEATMELLSTCIESVVGEARAPSRSIPLLNQSIAVLQELHDAEVAASQQVQQRMAELDDEDEEDDDEWDEK